MESHEGVMGCSSGIVWHDLTRAIRLPPLSVRPDQRTDHIARAISTTGPTDARRFGPFARYNTSVASLATENAANTPHGRCAGPAQAYVSAASPTRGPETQNPSHCRSSGEDLGRPKDVGRGTKKNGNERAELVCEPLFSVSDSNCSQHACRSIFQFTGTGRGVVGTAGCMEHDGSVQPPSRCRGETGSANPSALSSSRRCSCAKYEFSSLDSWSSVALGRECKAITGPANQSPQLAHAARKPSVPPSTTVPTRMSSKS